MKQKVFSIQEKMVAHLHSRWGFNKLNREIYLNHAIDAAIVAVITDQLIHSVAEHYRRENIREQKAPLCFLSLGEVFQGNWRLEYRLK